jgi:hypothetical protein
MESFEGVWVVGRLLELLGDFGVVVRQSLIHDLGTLCLAHALPCTFDAGDSARVEGSRVCVTQFQQHLAVDVVAI